MGLLPGVRQALRRWLRLGVVPDPATLAPDTDQIVQAFQDQIGISFGDPVLLRRALTHRSFLGGEQAAGPDSNERLEFLGDAVLELAVIEYLYHRFPDDREGELTQKKSLLVSRTVLADRAERCELGDFVLLSAAERDAGGGERRSILADAFEAVLGAIYCDQGFEVARRFVERWLLQDADRVLEDTEKRNFKSLLQEQIQAEFRAHPRYRVVSERGPDHDKRFTVEVVVGGRMLGAGVGSNKKEAEQQAARAALDSAELQIWLREMGNSGEAT
ncbi:MAG: ribonuclease III [Candidatus Eisenbacteria bacterium]|nr:ribonuclease III [Candidatus Eisenbacteria bacterium]